MMRSVPGHCTAYPLNANNPWLFVVFFFAGLLFLGNLEVEVDVVVFVLLRSEQLLDDVLWFEFQIVNVNDCHG